MRALCAAGKPDLGAVQIESVDSPLASSAADAPALVNASLSHADPDPDPSSGLEGGEAADGASSGPGSDADAASAAAEAVGPATLADVGRAPARQHVRCGHGDVSMTYL